MSTNKIYLGDGVYADFDGYQVKLTTEDSDQHLPALGSAAATNTIYLEPVVWKNLEEYVASLTVARARAASSKENE